jgi:hypothetical protein
MTARVMLPEGVLMNIAAQVENSITVVPVSIEVPPLGLEAGPGPAIEVGLWKLSLSAGE